MVTDIMKRFIGLESKSRASSKSSHILASHLQRYSQCSLHRSTCHLLCTLLEILGSLVEVAHSHVDHSSAHVHAPYSCFHGSLFNIVHSRDIHGLSHFRMHSTRCGLGYSLCHLFGTLLEFLSPLAVVAHCHVHHSVAHAHATE